MGRIVYTRAEWEAQTDDRRAMIADCTDFRLGVFTKEWDEGDDPEVDPPRRYVANHPRITLDDQIRASEAWNLPAGLVPKATGTGENRVEATRADRKAAVEALVRPVDAKGELIEDRIEAFKAQLTEGTDTDAELKKRREAPKRAPKTTPADAPVVGRG